MKYLIICLVSLIGSLSTLAQDVQYNVNCSAYINNKEVGKLTPPMRTHLNGDPIGINYEVFEFESDDKLVLFDVGLRNWYGKDNINSSDNENEDKYFDSIEVCIFIGDDFERCSNKENQITNDSTGYMKKFSKSTTFKVNKKKYSIKCQASNIYESTSN